MNPQFPRYLIAVCHSALAGTLLVGGTLHAFQTAANLTWEVAFYGSIAPSTSAVALGTVLLLCLGCIQLVSTALYIRSTPAGTTGLAVVSLMLIPWLTSPLNLVLLFSLVAMLAEEMSVPEWQGSTEPEDIH